MTNLGELPIGKFKQDPNDGLYKLGTLHYTADIFSILCLLDDYRKELISIKERLLKLENK